ncbi:MAG: BcsR/BcsP family cellulose biosynthesis protein [Pseudomonas sp.]
MDFQQIEADRHAPSPPEDLTFLLEHYQLTAFQYSELQRKQAVLAAIADWPLLTETVLPLLPRVEAVKLNKAS